MRIIRYKFSKYLKTIGALLIIFAFINVFIFRKKRYSETFVTVVKGADPKTIWDYLADFTNQQKLNPKVIEFEIEYEKGNFENWEYALIYHEASPTLPFIKYKNRGVFNILPKNSHHSKIGRPYRILSDFNSCSLGICFQTWSEMSFEELNSSDETRITERVDFDCPPILSYFCFRDLHAEKKLVHKNLIESLDIFSI